MIRNIEVVLQEGAIMPTLAHETDGGYDLYARESQIVPARESATFDTGVCIRLPEARLYDGDGFLASFKTVGFLKSKSGLNVKHGIRGEGVIDMGYTGSIKVKLYNDSGYDYKVEAGDKISQLVILPCFTPPLVQVDALPETERGAGGFGSSGR